MNTENLWTYRSETIFLLDFSQLTDHDVILLFYSYEGLDDLPYKYNVGFSFNEQKRQEIIEGIREVGWCTSDHSNERHGRTMGGVESEGGHGIFTMRRRKRGLNLIGQTKIVQQN